MNYVVRLFVLVAVGLACSFLISGCGKSYVDAVPRSSNAKPVFGSGSSPDKLKKSGDIDFSFVHPDHFAGLSFDVQRIKGRDELKEVPWDSLEEGLAELVGKANSDLDSIERVWLLLDRESVTAAMEAKPGGWYVTVVQYRSAPDLKQLADANASREASKSDSSDSDSDPGAEPETDADENKVAKKPVDAQLETIAQVIGDRQIVIGGKLAVEKMMALQSPAEGSRLSRLLSQLDFSSDVEGVVAIEPVRETLNSVFGIAAQFGGEEAKKFAALPDVLEKIEVRFSLEEDDSELLKIKALIDDKSMIEEVVKALREAIEYSNANTKPGRSAFGGVYGDAMKPKRGDKDKESAVAKIAEEVSLEIKEKSLLGVEKADDSVTIRLQKPTKISELIRAMVEDSEQIKSELDNEDADQDQAKRNE